MALYVGWQKLKVRAWGLLCSAMDCADATNLEIMCPDTKKKKQKNKNWSHVIGMQRISQSASQKGHLGRLKLKQLSMVQSHAV